MRCRSRGVGLPGRGPIGQNETFDESQNAPTPAGPGFVEFQCAGQGDSCIALQSLAYALLGQLSKALRELALRALVELIELEREKRPSLRFMRSATRPAIFTACSWVAVRRPARGASPPEINSRATIEAGRRDSAARRRADSLTW